MNLLTYQLLRLAWAIQERQRREATMKTPQLDEEKLYCGDRGRVTCGRPECAGRAAYYSGSDLSGQPLIVLPRAQALASGAACEGCGFQGESEVA